MKNSFNQKWIAAEQIIPSSITFYTLVPTLEDLINECHKKYNKKTALGLFSLMRCQISSLYCDAFLNEQSVQELWLLFYMSSYYNKRWTENKKGWENV